MSKFVEIEIRLAPAYGSGGFQSRFPNMARFLENYEYDKVLEEPPSLYHFVDVLTRLCNDPAIPDMDKGPIVRMHEKIEKVHAEAREQLLGRHLNELDRTLYRLEDLFMELEQELGWGA